MWGKNSPEGLARRERDGGMVSGSRNLNLTGTIILVVSIKRGGLELHCLVARTTVVGAEQMSDLFSWQGGLETVKDKLGY